MYCEQLIVVNSNSINNLIKQPLKSTQRIKFTCFDVSSKFIVFGATSGGIYIFNRDPCHFIKLIPTKEGSITIVSISPDENIIASGSCKGHILIVENFIISNNNNFYKCFTEHDGNNLTYFEWHENRLFSGDDSGKISLTEVTNNNLVKAFFHSPCVSLMDLDSSIVQIDSFSFLLLISTQTRTFLCNTEKEQYKQIGKKNRDGNYGACFLNEKIELDFNLTKECNSDPFENVKIYCARPGARIWEAAFDTSVVCTHQFKNCLIDVSPTTKVYLEENSESRLKIEHFDMIKVKENFNFSKIYSFCNKYIFSYNEDAFYIFNPSSAELSFWSNGFGKIKEIKLYKNDIYIQTVDKFFHVTLMSVENLAVKTLINKQYYLCAELCAYYRDHLMALVQSSDKIHLLSVLKDKLVSIQATDLLDEISPILNKIKENEKINIQKLKSGIIVLNSHLVSSTLINKYEEVTINKNQDFMDETLQKVKNLSYNLTEKIKEKVAVTDNNRGSNCDNEIDKKNSINVISDQYKINLVNENAELPYFYKTIAKVSLAEIVEKFEQFQRQSVENGEEIEKVDLWCSNQYLKIISKNLKVIEQMSKNSNEYQYLLRSFSTVNFHKNYYCICGFPLPKAHTVEVKYYPIGCEIFKNLEPNIERNMYEQFPLKLKLKFSCEEKIDDILSTLIQFNDEDLLMEFVNKFSYDNWDEAMKLMIKLKNNICLNCDRNFDECMQNFITSWSFFGKLMVKCIGGISAIEILKRYSQFIPSDSLKEDFYQLCLFATFFDNIHDGLRIPAVDVANNCLNDDAMKSQFEAIVGTFLNKKHLENDEPCNSKSSVVNIDDKCFHCGLPFNNLIFEKTVRLKCGHIYHAFCNLKIPDFCDICHTKIK